MKKFNVCIFAVAAMAMAMTSCNKEEALNQGSVFVSVEENEITNNTKTHLEGDHLYWDNDDRLVLYDNSGNAATYTANTSVYPTEFEFQYHVNPAAPFNRDNAPLSSVYPEASRFGNQSRIFLPYIQTTNNGELKEFPMFGKGTFNHFVFKNVCGVIRMSVKGNVTLDSIAITTDKKVNGVFNVNYTESENEPQVENILEDAGRDNNGTKTVVLHIANPIALNATTPTEINMYVPATTYGVFNITFFAGSQSYTLRNTQNITISRTHFSMLPVNLSQLTAVDFVYGSTNVAFNLNENGTRQAYIAKGNIQYIGGTKNRKWFIADNGFDCIGFGQKEYNMQEDDRDIFAWGANGIVDLRGNILGNYVFIWKRGEVNAFMCYNGTELANNNDWGTNSYKNADNNRTWKTPTMEEFENILDNNNHGMVTVMGVRGMLIVPGRTLTVNNDATLTKEQWNTYEAAGAAFFPMTYYRTTNNWVEWNYLMRNDASMYWTANSDANNTDNALAYVLGLDGASQPKTNGGFVRLISLAD